MRCHIWCSGLHLRRFIGLTLYQFTLTIALHGWCSDVLIPRLLVDFWVPLSCVLLFDFLIGHSRSVGNFSNNLFNYSHLLLFLRAGRVQWFFHCLAGVDLRWNGTLLLNCLPWRDSGSILIKCHRLTLLVSLKVLLPVLALVLLLLCTQLLVQEFFLLVFSSFILDLAGREICGGNQFGNHPVKTGNSVVCVRGNGMAVVWLIAIR